jgi:hypothetical protein
MEVIRVPPTRVRMVSASSPVRSHNKLAEWGGYGAQVRGKWDGYSGGVICTDSGLEVLLNTTILLLVG